jgi:hypothetical protein
VSIRRSFSSTVQAPHWPWSQPFFGLVTPSRSRRASSSVVRVSTVSWRAAPSTWSVISASRPGAYPSGLREIHVAVTGQGSDGHG